MRAIAIVSSLLISLPVFAELTVGDIEEPRRSQFGSGTGLGCGGRSFDQMSGPEREAYFQCMRMTGQVLPPEAAGVQVASAGGGHFNSPKIVAIASCRYHRERKFELLVYEEGTDHFYRWPTSPGRQGMSENGDMRTYLDNTPGGSGGHHIRALGNLRKPGERHHIVSDNKTYAGAPMFDAVWIGKRNGFAVHGTTDSNYSKLGYPASSGCLRLLREHSRQFYDMVDKTVEKHGPHSVKIHFDGYHGCVNQHGQISNVPNEKRDQKVDSLFARYFRPKKIIQPRHRPRRNNGGGLLQRLFRKRN